MSTTTMTIRLSGEDKERLARLANHTNRSKSFLAGKAITDYVERELAIVEGIELGLADAKDGRVVPHQDAMKRLRATISSSTPRK